MRPGSLRIVVALGLGALAAGCASTPEKAPALTEHCPVWVNQGGAAFDDDRLYAVGAVSGVRNMALARDAADARARANLQAQLETYVKRLIKDYQASTSDLEASDEEQRIEAALKTVVEGTLRGAQVVDRCWDPEAKTLYSLVRVDYEAFAGALEEARRLDARIKEYISRNARAAWQELDATPAR